jgi:hypothetical protein
MEEEERMTTPQDPRKPARPAMYGITPTPYEIPSHRLPEPKLRKSGRPWFISLFAIANLIQGGVYLLLALVPWSDPTSDLASTMISHRDLVFGLLPRFVQPSRAINGAAFNHVLPGLSIIFLLLGLIYIFAAWKLWDMDPWWYFIIRWAMMLSALKIVATFALAISADYVVASGPRLISNTTMLLMMPYIFWNMLIFGYFVSMPDVPKAYDSNG